MPVNDDTPSATGALAVVLNQRSATAPYHRETVVLQGDEVPGKAIGFDPEGRLAAIAVGGGGAVNVKDFGAVGDNWTDSTAAFVAAFAAVPLGGKVFIPCGGYLITSTLTPPTRAVIEGESTSGTELRFAPAVSSALFDAGGSNDNITLRNFTCSNVLSSGAGIRTTAFTSSFTTELFIRNVNFNYFTDAAIILTSTYYLLIDECRFLNIQNIAAKGGSDTTSATALRIGTLYTAQFNKCRFSNNDQDLVISVGGATQTVSNCSFESSGIATRAGWSPDHFIDVGQDAPMAVKAFSFLNNYVEDQRTATGKAGLRLRGCESPVVSKCLWSGSLGGVTHTHNFIEVGGNCSDATISANVFMAVLQKFINVTGTKIVRAFSNTFIDRPEVGETRLASKSQIAPFVTAGLVDLGIDLVLQNVGTNAGTINYLNFLTNAATPTDSNTLAQICPEIVQESPLKSAIAFRANTGSNLSEAMRINSFLQLLIGKPIPVGEAMLQSTMASTSTNTIRDALVLFQSTTGAADVGFGVAIRFMLQRRNDDNLHETAARITSKWSAISQYSTTADLAFWTALNGNLVERMTVLTTGDVELPTAGGGIVMKTPDGTKRYRVSVNNAGAVVATLL